MSPEMTDDRVKVLVKDEMAEPLSKKVDCTICNLEMDKVTDSLKIINKVLIVLCILQGLGLTGVKGVDAIKFLVELTR